VGGIRHFLPSITSKWLTNIFYTGFPFSTILIFYNNLKYCCSDKKLILMDLTTVQKNTFMAYFLVNVILSPLLKQVSERSERVRWHHDWDQRVKGLKSSTCRQSLTPGCYSNQTSVLTFWTFAKGSLIVLICKGQCWHTLFALASGSAIKGHLIESHNNMHSTTARKQLSI